MKQPFSSTAMVLAAGLGTRMRPLTLEKPKPLQIVGGKTMLDSSLDKLVGAGIKRAVVNTFHLAEQVEEHLKSRQDIEIILSHETEILDTGGGVANAIGYFDGLPFYCLNADLPWQDEGTPGLIRMREAWDPEKMDVLMLLMRTEEARGGAREGDFLMENDGRLRRLDVQPPRPFVFISAQILKPSLFMGVPEKVFSNHIIWNEAEAKGRLYGIEHHGTCYHVGTPEDLCLANELLRSGKGWRV